MCKYLLFLSALLLIFSCKNSSITVEERAMEIHKKALTIDSHTDTPMRLLNEGFDLAQKHDPRAGGGKVDFPRMEEGGLDAIFLAVFTGQGKCDSAGYAKVNSYAVRIFDSIHAVLQRNQDVAELALTANDAYRIAATDKRAVFIGVENGYPLAHNIKNVSDFYNRGARYITLSHSWNNLICDSSTDTIAQFNGLSEFGYQVVKEMNRVGMMVDVSHISDSSFYDVIGASKVPVIASHSCARAICDNPRNMNDDMLKTLAENGGVCQMCILSDYVKKMPRNASRDSAQNIVRQRYKGFQNLSDSLMDCARRDWHAIDDKFPPNLASVKDVVDHIDHIVKVAGIDHVGIGTDFDGGGGVKDCYDVSELPNITIELVKRGYTEQEIIKIWGGNLMRVLTANEHYAQSFSNQH